MLTRTRSSRNARSSLVGVRDGGQIGGVLSNEPHSSRVTQQSCSFSPREPRTDVHTESYTAVFLTANMWKQPRWPSAGASVNKPWSLQTTEYDSARKGNELSTRDETRRKYKSTVLHEVSQPGKAASCMIPTARHSRGGKNHRDSKTIHGH